MARLNDASFDAEALDLISKQTGKSIKTLLHQKLKQLRREAAAGARQTRADRVQAVDGRVTFDDWDTKDEPFPDTCAHVLEAVCDANNAGPHLFCMALGPTRLVPNPITGLLEAEPLVYSSMRHEIAQVTRFCHTKTNKHNQEYVQDVPVPEAIAQHLINNPALPFPPLLGIATTPFFDSNGVLITGRGYNAASLM